MDEIVGGDGKRRYNLVRDDGSMAAQNVQIVKAYTPEQEGSTFGALDVYDLQCKEYTITLTADGWADGRQTVSLPEIQADAGTVFVGLPAEATLSEIQAAANAGIRCIGRQNGSLIFKALGTIPTIDINIYLVLTGGQASIINALGGMGGDSESLYVTEEITTSKTWTVPAGVTEIQVMLFGGGGGGESSNYGAGGGGSGYMAKGTFAVTPGEKYSVVIGAGGNAGRDGGQTSFGDLLSASGGNRGGGGVGGDGFAGGGGGADIDDHAYYEGNFGRGQAGGGGNGGAAGYNTNRDGVSSLTAKGGSGGSRSGFSYYSGGGGGGMNGGDGGDGYSHYGGGGGGYGSQKICQSGGKGYGAGGNGGEAGAQGIGIIKYLKP